MHILGINEIIRRGERPNSNILECDDYWTRELPSWIAGQNGGNEGVLSDREDNAVPPQPGGRSPQDLVDAVDRLEAEEDEVERELNGGIMPNGSRDLDEVKIVA